ncbi:HAL protein kinase [Spizellomyces punctatus DAOM BR117]|uniref:HAL protein kinase n=1 Tax=Spizellomyces punctatus (strain DAOM BR117) TaxID=645134 RepID=A0A0L0HD76_SPIPD|nr:HAL protein kinase [Spizellomyces punctatus DAOM BR117]KNC99062.1 HAL protein kinase [Spizellomyces punctatus DAOM BR117]|eukprot:XP_016607102.1 HAL protein kinase [Spizellomyces punctatus DAOM BR117]
MGPDVATTAAQGEEMGEETTGIKESGKQPDQDTTCRRPREPAQQHEQQHHHHHHLHLDNLLIPFKKLLHTRSTTTPPPETCNPKKDALLPVNPIRTMSNPTTLREKYGTPQTLIGRGANGSCYAVRKSNQPKPQYACKEFRPRHKHESEKEYMKKLSAEFCIGSQVHHPNLLRTHDLVLDGNHIYTVMPYCPHGDLYTYIQTHPKLSMDQITHLFSQLIHGVAYLHKTGIAHRDLKPENILFSKPEHIKIIDFGSADVYKPPTSTFNRLSHGKCGSGPYIPPEELASPASYDARKVDVWACGIILMAMLTHRFPWANATMSDVDYAAYVKYVEAVKKGTNARPPKIFESLPQGPRDLVFKMLQPDPQLRVQIDQVLEDEWFKKVDEGESPDDDDDEQKSDAECGR